MPAAIELYAFVLQKGALEVEAAIYGAGAQPAVSVDHPVPGHMVRTGAHGPTHNPRPPGIAECGSDLAIGNNTTLWHPLQQFIYPAKEAFSSDFQMLLRENRLA